MIYGYSFDRIDSVVPRGEAAVALSRQAEMTQRKFVIEMRTATQDVERQNTENRSDSFRDKHSKSKVDTGNDQDAQARVNFPTDASHTSGVNVSREKTSNSVNILI